MFAPVPLALAAFAASAAIDVDRYGPFPATPTFASEPVIEQPYRDGGRMVGLPYLNPDAADRACPRGFEIRRQETREDGSKVNMIFTLRCR